MIRRLTLATLVAGIWLAAFAPVASAECLDWPIRADEPLDIGYAFVATVTESSRDVDPVVRDMADYDWHVELHIDRVYRGAVPNPLVYNGWDVGCHFLRSDNFQEGDRVFIAVERMARWWLPTDPFGGDELAWRWTEGRWALYEEALSYGSDPEYYPGAAREATTTEDILAVVRAAALPETSTAPGGAGLATGLVLGGLAVGFVVGVRRLTTSRR